MTKTSAHWGRALRAGFSLSVLAIVLAPSVAQRPTGSASGSLQVCVPFPSYTGVIPATGVSVSGWCGSPGPFPTSGSATTTASCSDTQFTLGGQGSANLYFSGSYAMGATVTVLLQAPAGANALLQLSHQSTLSVQPGTSVSGSGSITVTIPGQTYTRPTATNSSGSASWPVVVPAGGLTISVTYSESVNAVTLTSLLGVSSSTTLNLSWSYPGVTQAGGPSPGCLGPADCWTNGSPRIGTSGFGFHLSHAPANGAAAAVLGLGGLTTPLPFGGLNVWIDPAQPFVLDLVPTDASGTAFDPLPLPNNAALIGFAVWCQFLPLEPPGCTPSGLSASNAVRIVVQP